MSAISPIKAAGPVSLALVANQIDLATATKTAGDAAIGVTRTFDPDGVNLQGVARYVDRSGGIAIGMPSITFSTRAPTKNSRVYRATVKVTLPTLEITSASTSSGISPQPTKAYDTSVVMDFILPERSATWERKALCDIILSLLVTTITASDGNPSDATKSPLRNIVENLDRSLLM